MTASAVLSASECRRAPLRPERPLLRHRDDCVQQRSLLGARAVDAQRKAARPDVLEDQQRRREGHRLEGHAAVRHERPAVAAQTPKPAPRGAVSVSAGCKALKDCLGFGTNIRVLMLMATNFRARKVMKDNESSNSMSRVLLVLGLLAENLKLKTLEVKHSRKP